MKAIVLALNYDDQEEWKKANRGRFEANGWTADIITPDQVHRIRGAEYAELVITERAPQHPDFHRAYQEVVSRVRKPPARPAGNIPAYDRVREYLKARADFVSEFHPDEPSTDWIASITLPRDEGSFDLNVSDIEAVLNAFDAMALLIGASGIAAHLLGKMPKS